MVYSFDIFDTLITRKTLTPRGVFLVVQKKLEDSNKYNELQNSFAALRYDAERMAEKYIGDREVNIDDIYDVLLERCHISKNDAEDIKAIELNTEIELAYLIEENVTILKEKIALGERVILISDMYWNEKYIRKILCSLDDVFEDIPIYVSCDCNATKRSGHLYSYVREKECLEYTDWIHYGDNLVADGNVPDFYGIKSVITNGYCLDEIEKYISDKYQIEKNYDAQILLGLVKVVCKNQNDYSKKMGALCGSAILLPYVKWILKECSYYDIKKLVFMSRDGYIIKRIADLLIESEKIDVKSVYAYVSRKVLRDKGDLGKLAIDYLKSLMGNDNSAIVDFHGTGASLRNIAGQFDNKIVGLYYLLDGQPRDKNVELYGYTFVPILSGMLEIFCRAPHGVVEGYIKNDSVIEPRISKVPYDVWSDCGLFQYIDGVLSFTNEYQNLLKNGLPEINLIDLGKDIIWYCENIPDKKTSDFIGDFPHSDNNTGEISGFAPLLSNTDIQDIYGGRGNENLVDVYRGTNIEYSLKRSGKKYKSIIKEAVEHEAGKDVNVEKIALYAAGRYGYEAYYRFKKSSKHDVVAWVDMNYQSCDEDLIQPPATIKNVFFDKLVVCLNSRKMYEDVADMLSQNDIPKNKIVWVCDYWPEFFV